MADPVVQKFLAKGGELARFREGRRTVTVAYGVIDGKVAYGASIHEQTSGSDQFEKSIHNFSAVFRYETSPIVVDDEWDRNITRAHGVRKRMFELGAYSSSPQHLRWLSQKRTEECASA